MREDDGDGFNRFEWIIDNDQLLPILQKWLPIGENSRSTGVAGDGSSWSVTAGPKSLVALGVGSSRIEEFLDHGFAPVVGLDVDSAALQEGAKRVRSAVSRQSSSGALLAEAGSVRWAVSDLSAESLDLSVEVLDDEAGISLPASPRLREALPKHYAIVLDKGTLDYLICEEPIRCCRYVRNAALLCGAVATGSPASAPSTLSSRYVLVSFRSRALLLGLLEGVFGFRLLDEVVLSADSKNPISIYVLQAPAVLTASSSLEAEASSFCAVLDEHFKRPENRLWTEKDEALLLSNLDGVSLQEAWCMLFSAEIRVEYAFDLFEEDVKHSHPEAAATGRLSGREMIEFLEING